MSPISPIRPISPPVKDFAEKFAINYPVAMAESEVVHRYGARSLPTTFYIDREGKVIDVMTGMVKRDQIEEKIRAALGGSEKSGQR